MYGYEKLIDISPEQILQKVSETQIFEWIFGQELDISPTARYTSPFREDDNPDCRFQTRTDGTLLFIDFGEPRGSGRTHRTCFNAVMHRYNCTLNTALKIISKEFCLSEVAEDYEVVEVTEKKEANGDLPYKTILTWEERTIEKRDKLYWSQFLITPQNLIEDGTGLVSKVYIDSIKGRTSFVPFSICYALTGFQNHVKIYQPHNNPKYKWISNCDANDIGNINNLPLRGKELVIQKSYKDHRVVRNMNFGLNVVWTMNEGAIPDYKILYDLSIRFDLITIFYDNDKKGREAALKLMSVFLLVNPEAKVRCVHLPVRRYPHKDPGEFVKGEGRAEMQEVLQYIGIKPSN